MKDNLYLLVCIWSFCAVSCDKKAPSELNAVNYTNNNKIDGTNDNKIDKSFEFLHRIKEDLRRNNDDYAEIVRTVTTTPLSTEHSNLKLYYNKENITDDFNRRAYESLSDDENAKESKEIKTITTTIMRFSKITQTALTEPKVKNMNKLQMLFEENKDLLKDFISNKATTISSMVVKLKPNLRMKARENDKKTELPTSEQLDMAPAKGGRIHMLRIKGRLCQRNVLVPEGPKYDSKGKIYLPAFSSAIWKKKFEYTMPPKIILPRCCNCCKKSVLGCE